MTTVQGADPVALQRRTVRLLVVTQVAGGLGIGSAVSVSGLLALDRLAGVGRWRWDGGDPGRGAGGGAAGPAGRAVAGAASA